MSVTRDMIFMETRYHSFGAHLFLELNSLILTILEISIAFVPHLFVVGTRTNYIKIICNNMIKLCQYGYIVIYS